ncbi:hypothetical protein ACTNEO_18305 [Gracilibacillus sp. HCP3S3_G5_1]|uniref:hypothetical protein n=1 Tax=unclassified Gracilibacillus TaxID=2625209 RepID=UPI003F8B683A
MNSWYGIVLILSGVIATYFISKKARNDQNELTRKGFYGIISVFLIIFVITIIITVLSAN